MPLLSDYATLNILPQYGAKLEGGFLPLHTNVVVKEEENNIYIVFFRIHAQNTTILGCKCVT
jgi:hypothetical protein